MESSATDFLPPKRTLTALREAAEGCRGCPLWREATQTVFGRGRRTAEIMLVGEQPGDQEDIQGEPFVGPAGGILADALEQAGIDRKSVYITNAVKHFKWRARGKRRLHQAPQAEEIKACRPWLSAEIETVKPHAILALGATAGKSLFGSSIRVTRDRGALLDSPLAPVAGVTIHPSAILRVRERQEREAAFADLVNDLKSFAEAAAR